MKTSKCILSICFIAVLAIMTFSSCSKSEETENNCYFTLGIKDYSFIGSSSSSSEATIEKYAQEVENTYMKALGMTSGNTIFLSGDYSKVAAEMKSKFDAVTLPTAPTVSGYTYSYKYVLSGCDVQKSEKTQLVDVVSKTFTNK